MRCSRQLLTLTIMTVVPLAGCVFQHDDQLNANGNEIDFHSFGGVSIVGERIHGGVTDPAGPLPLDELQAGMFSACFDEIVASSQGYLCKGSLPPRPLQDPEDICNRVFCLSRIYQCAGYKAQELAESVQIWELSTRLHEYTATLSGDYIDVELTGGRDGTATTFRIPPLSSESKTLALLSANAMFRASAREAAKLSSTQWQGGQTCVDYLATLPPQPVVTHVTEQRSKHKAAPIMVTALEMFAVLITENMARLVEATRALAGNQQNVGAAGLSKNPDQADAQDGLWNGPVNSQTAALRVLLGDPAKKLELLGCRTELYRPTHRKALDLLRVARLSDAYRSEADVDTDTLVRQTICVFAQDRQENDPEYVLPEGCPGSLGSMPEDVVESFYQAQDISEADVALARRYLAEEEVALDLLIRVETGTDPVRVYSSAPFSGVRPAAYYVGKALGDQPILATSDEDAFLQYSGRGTLPTIDYLRRAAENLLAKESNGTDLLEADEEQLLVSASVLARSVVGPERIVVTPVEANGNGGKGTGRGITEGPIVGGENFDTVEVELYGASKSDLERILFLNGKTGYRCLFEGNLGGEACDYSEYLINPTLAEYFRPATSTVGPLEHGLRFHIKENIRHWSEAFSEIYIVKAFASGGPKLLGLFDFTSVDPSDSGPHVPNPRLIIPVVRDTEADDIVRTIVQRPPGNCSEPAEMCGDLGIRRNYIPTLENELIEDSDNYESSWKHYIILARQAAEKADALGEQLVQAGLDMDLRAEQAQRELEAICGGVFNFDPVQANGCDANDQSCDAVSQYIVDNPALQSCLPESMGGGMSRIPYATAGSRPLCVYRNTETGAVCGEENAGECPIMRLEGETSCSTDDFRLDQQKVADETLVAELIDETLNIFQSTGPREVSTADCVNDVARLKDELDVNGVPGDDAIIEILEGANWISKVGIGAIAKKLGIDVYPLHHYSVTYGNMVLWTTRVSNPANCPCNEPWREAPDDTTCAESGRLEDCVRTASDPATVLWPPINPDLHEEWLDEEISTYVPRRKEWGQKLRRLVVALGALTGSIPRVRMAGWYFRQRQPGKKRYRASELYTDGAIAPGLWVRMTEARFADEPLTCIEDRYSVNRTDVYTDATYSSQTEYEKDPDLGFCHIRDEGSNGNAVYGMFRFEFPLEYELVPAGEATLGDFWGPNNLSTFLGGTYDGVGERWRLRSPYMDDLIVRAQTNSNQEPELVFVEGNRTTDWQNTHNHGKDPYNGMPANIFGTTAWPIEDHIDPIRLVDLLEFACQVSSRSVGPVPDCDASDPSKVPFVDSKKDIDKLKAYLQCASNDVQRVAERIIIPNLPNKLVEGFQKNGLEGLYGEYAGENLKALLAIEDSLRDLGTAGDSIKTILHEAAVELENVKLEAENLDHRKVIAGLRTTTAVLQACIGATSAWSGSGFEKFVTGVGVAVSALYAAVAVLEAVIGIFEQKILENQENQNYNQAMLAFSAKMGELKGVFNGIADVYSDIQANLATLDQNQNRAVGWWAVGMGLDGDAAGHVYPVNTVMRRRLNTLRVRYERAATRAKKLAFIARRAIEFRLGVDLSQMHNEMTLVPAPASWADRICDMQGFDYDRLRDAYPEDEELMDPALQGSDNYAHWYIGDYVTLLSDFVESYNLDHPFTDERDIAVLSVKDDLMKARAQCEVPSRNLLYYSEDIGENRPLDDGFSTSFVGWQPGGCEPDPDTVINCVPEDPQDSEDCLAVDRCVQVYRDVEASQHCGPDFCYGYNPASVDSNTMALPHGADLLVDVPLPDYRKSSGRTEHWKNSGYYEQIVSSVPSGDYVLSWWARHPRDLATAPQDYRVEVRETIVPGGQQYPTVHDDVFAGNQNEWRRETIMFTLEQGQDLRVRIHPSDEDDSYLDALENPAFGAIWIWGAQLERVYCPEGDCNGVEPDAYQRNTSKVTVTQRVCPDTDGAVMRQDFEYKCVCLGYENGICPEGSEGAPDKQCFWEYPFELLLSRIESGDLIPSNNIAIGNFNYRHEALAVNVVGTNVIDCTNPQATSNCYTNAFVPYTLQHMGWVEVKNHERKTMEFSMPIARIEHGKGLTAEVVLTNPVTGTHAALLSEYWKDGLRGRPIQGQYMLRIWDTGNIVWSRIEVLRKVAQHQRHSAGPGRRGRPGRRRHHRPRQPPPRLRRDRLHRHRPVRRDPPGPRHLRRQRQHDDPRGRRHRQQPPRLLRVHVGPLRPAHHRAQVCRWATLVGKRRNRWWWWNHRRPADRRGSLRL